jgi:hypothetical protein
MRGSRRIFEDRKRDILRELNAKGGQVTDIPELVEQASGTDREALDAAQRLARIGVPAVAAISETLSSPFVSHGHLPDALRLIYAAAPVDVVAAGLTAEEFDVFMAAVSALVERGDEQSGQAIADRILVSELTAVRRAELVKACGDLGDSQAIPTIRRALAQGASEQRADDEPPRLLVEAVVALAKLGDFSEGGRLVPFLADGFPPTQAMAANALRIAVGPGMLAGLAGLLDAAVPEGSAAAVDPLFVLGVPAATDALVAAVRSDEFAVRRNARVRVNDILGTDFSDSPEDLDRLEGRWSEIRATWDAGLRYRSGRPFSVAGLLELSQTEGFRREEVLEELLLATGSRTGRARAELTARFPGRGAHYRWGHLVPSSDVLA